MCGCVRAWSVPGILTRTPPTSPRSDMWKNQPDNAYPSQSFDPEALRREKRKEMEQEIRIQVGELARASLQTLLPTRPPAASGSAPSVHSRLAPRACLLIRVASSRPCLARIAHLGPSRSPSSSASPGPSFPH